jgi:hypothetical protein
MQARLQIHRYPPAAAVATLIAAAIGFGGVLGYTLKPASTFQDPGRVTVVDRPAISGQSNTPCFVTDQGRKAC